MGSLAYLELSIHKTVLREGRLRLPDASAVTLSGRWQSKSLLGLETVPPYRDQQLTILGGVLEVPQFAGLKRLLSPDVGPGLLLFIEAQVQRRLVVVSNSQV